MSIIDLATDIANMAEYEPLPRGLYPMELMDAEIKFNAKNPDGFITCVFKIDSVDFPADYDAGNAPEGVLVTLGFTRIPTPSDRRSVKPFKNLMEALDQPVSGTSIDTDSWIGSRSQGLIGIQEFNGALTNFIERIGPLPKV